MAIKYCHNPTGVTPSQNHSSFVTSRTDPISIRSLDMSLAGLPHSVTLPNGLGQLSRNPVRGHPDWLNHVLEGLLHHRPAPAFAEQEPDRWPIAGRPDSAIDRCDVEAELSGIIRLELSGLSSMTK